MGLATFDPLLYQELASELRERHLPTESVVPGARIPKCVAVILTSPSEADRFSHPRVLAVPSDGERTALWAAVEQALHPDDPTLEIVVGIDPGPRPGYAVLSGDRCLAAGNLEAPETAAELAVHVRRRFPSRALVIRVGDGDRLSRERILNALAPLRPRVELVNERGTTPRGQRRPRDAVAARAIARGTGRPVGRTGPAPLLVTPGEVANLQRLSRERSNGQFTIPRSEAHRVLRGELTLNEAVVQGERRYHSRPGPNDRSRATEH